MKSKRQSGLDFQRWIKAWLEERNWLVHNQVPIGRMIVVKGKKIFISQRNDLFGCFDLICKKENRPTLWIQATLHKSLKEKVDKMIDCLEGCFKDDNVQIWLKRETGVIDIYDPYGDNIGKIIRRKFYSAEGINYEF